MRYAFIRRHRSVWPIRIQCRVLKVSVTGYHEHFGRQARSVERRHLSEAALGVHVRAVYLEQRGAYGWPRVWRELRAQGLRVGKQRVQRLMQRQELRGRGKKRFRVVTTDSKHSLPIAPNRLDRKFLVGVPDRVWVGDITYIGTEEGWLLSRGGSGSVQSKNRGLGTSFRDKGRDRDEGAGNGLVSAQVGERTGTDVSQRPGQPVCQR